MMPPENSSTPALQVRAVVFDLGKVLLDWDPNYLYQDLIPDPAACDDFLSRICTMDWHHLQDRGRPMAENVAELVGRYPDKADLIQAWDTRWPDMFRGAIDGTVTLLRALHERDVPLFCITNMPAEKYPWTVETFPFMSLFEDVIVSGYEKIAKPDPRIFEIALKRSGFAANELAFIDDSRPNIETAKAMGFVAHQFVSPSALRVFLSDIGVLPGPADLEPDG